MTQSEKDEIKAALGELAERIKSAYAENDAGLYLSAFDEDAIVSMPGNPPVRGHERLRQAFEARAELPPGATFEVKPLELEAISSEWAYAYGTDILEFTAPRSEAAVRQTMSFLVLIRNTPAGWKTFREVVSADQVNVI